jgi:hypothetical protein
LATGAGASGRVRPKAFKRSAGVWLISDLFTVSCFDVNAR